MTNKIRAAGVKMYQRKEIVTTGKRIYQKFATSLKVTIRIPHNTPKRVPIIEPHIINSSISNIVTTSFEGYDSVQLYKVDDLRDSI